MRKLVKNDWEDLTNSEVRIRKPGGQTAGPYKCALTNGQAIFLGEKADVEQGDELLRDLPTGKQEVFAVLGVQYQPALGDLPASHTVELRKGPRQRGEASDARLPVSVPTISVFVSWSGDRSRAIALALRDWLPRVVAGVDPWVSSEDIAKGTRWSAELERQLSDSEFGIVCLVAENVSEPWVTFEAGALSRSVNGRVAPLLVGIDVGVVPRPLQQFQCTRAEKNEVLKLVRSISKVQAAAAATPEHLAQRFEAAWPTLEAALTEIQAQAPVPRVSPGPVTAGDGHYDEAARDRTTALAREWSGSVLVSAREALRAWIRTKSASVKTVGAQITALEQTPMVRQLVEFVEQVGILGRRGLIDRTLAHALFGTEMIRTCYELEGGAVALVELWPDWWARMHPAIQATRQFLQAAHA